MSAAPWRAASTQPMLKRRALLFASVRDFFAQRAVLEVDTPFLVNHGVTDVHVHSARVAFDGRLTHFLHTSPEYAMKRLLACGSGDIYQICHVVRALETSRLHNPEFTLLEWYRCGFALSELMAEVEALLHAVAPQLAAGVTERLSYVDAFRRTLALDPFAASMQELFDVAATNGLRYGASGADVSRDDLLDFLMAVKIGPGLGRDGLTFVYAYPASQAALARLVPHDPRVAERFELYRHGVELANGYHELASASEQERRFAHDGAERARRALPTVAADQFLLAALGSGLPDCAGVALGIDRLLMLETGAVHIDDVIAFPTERA